MFTWDIRMFTSFVNILTVYLINLFWVLSRLQSSYYLIKSYAHSQIMEDRARNSHRKLSNLSELSKDLLHALVNSFTRCYVLCYCKADQYELVSELLGTPCTAYDLIGFFWVHILLLYLICFPKLLSIDKINVIMYRNNFESKTIFSPFCKFPNVVSRK